VIDRNWAVAQRVIRFDRSYVWRRSFVVEKRVMNSRQRFVSLGRKTMYIITVQYLSLLARMSVLLSSSRARSQQRVSRSPRPTVPLWLR
jgi:hypothetical protein